MEISIYRKLEFEASSHIKNEVADFLFEHLDEYGDAKEDIAKAIDYAQNKGGFLAVGTENINIVGAVVVNETGMTGYIPENILVYIAVDKSTRGKGYGKALMKKVIESAEGSIALHVEPDNPAKKLYEKLGFENKYLEMRYSK